MGDVYQRAGRGGAGNFYSQKDVEVATKAASETKDLEAQKPDPSADDNNSTSTKPAKGAPSVAAGGMARTGRGGAGNFVEPSSADVARASSSSSSSPPPPVPPKDVPPKDTPPASGGGGPVFSGRGGAGNYQQNSSGLFTGPNAEQERKRQEALDAGFLDDIKAQLPREPPRIYHMHIRGKGRIPTEPDMQ